MKVLNRKPMEEQWGGGVGRREETAIKEEREKERIRLL